MRVEPVDQLHLARAHSRQAELAVDALQELGGRERRAEDVGRGDVGSELAQEGAEKRRLPRPHVARDADEAARFLEAEPEVRERLGVLGREKEVTRVRRQPERRVVEPEEALVHPRPPRIPCSL